MKIPISFHEVAKFLPSHPFRGSHLLLSRDVFDKSTNLFVRPRGKSLYHLSRYVNWPADYKGFNLEGRRNDNCLQSQFLIAPAPQAGWRASILGDSYELQPGLCWGWSCYCRSRRRGERSEYFSLRSTRKSWSAFGRKSDCDGLLEARSHSVHNRLVCRCVLSCDVYFCFPRCIGMF